MNLKNCPFKAVLSNGKYYITFGDKVMSNESFSSLEDAQKYVNKKPWDLIIVASAILANDLINYKNNEK